MTKRRNGRDDEMPMTAEDLVRVQRRPRRATSRSRIEPDVRPRQQLFHSSVGGGWIDETFSEAAIHTEEVRVVWFVSVTGRGWRW